MKQKWATTIKKREGNKTSTWNLKRLTIQKKGGIGKEEGWDSLEEKNLNKSWLWNPPVCIQQLQIGKAKQWHLLEISSNGGVPWYVKCKIYICGIKAMENCTPPRISRLEVNSKCIHNNRKKRGKENFDSWDLKRLTLQNKKKNWERESKVKN